MKRDIFLLFFIMTAILYSFAPIDCHALPTNPNPLTSGITIDPVVDNTLTIHQVPLKGIIEYEGFSIGTNEGVYFDQPIGGATLNRVTGGDPSSILGRLGASGQIFLVNPNGIVFGHTAQVDTAGIVASTLDIEDMDFLENVFIFSGPGGHVVNQGQIRAPGGFVVLMGSEVQNTGMISTELGSVALVSGDAVTLNLDTVGMINVVIDADTAANLRNADAAVSNLGSIEANGGTVLLTAGVLSDVFDKAINNEGIIEATDLVETDGQIVLWANEDVDVGGRLSGGEVQIVSSEGNVTHLAKNEVTTMGDNFIGYAGIDYNVGNDTFIDVQEGIIDIYAKENVYLGSNEIQELTQYTWEYLEGDRSYHFKSHGFYIRDQNDELVYVPFVFGENIGKDGTSPTEGTFFIYESLDEIDLFASFFEPRTSITRTCHTDPLLNLDQNNHVLIDGVIYSWEDMAHLGDEDYNDAIISFELEKMSTTPGAQLNSLDNIFITADQGEIYQVDGNINAHRLMLLANTGIGGTSANGGLRATTDYISARNKYSGNLFIENMADLTVADLTGMTGLNMGIHGGAGIINHGLSIDLYKPINLLVHGDLDIYEPILAIGDITLGADGYIHQMENGNIIITQMPYGLYPPSNVHSTSHEIEVWTNEETFDVQWGLPEQPDEQFYHFIATADMYTMDEGTRVQTNGGDATMMANDDIILSLVDADNGNAYIRSEYGSILDGDLGVVPGDYDVIAHHIDLLAPEGMVGTDETEGEIDIGYPDFAFSYVFDTFASTIPDMIADPYTVVFTSSGDWVFKTSLPAAEDSPNWHFHIATIEDVFWPEPEMVMSIYEMPYPNGSERGMSETVHVGPYYIDMTAPIIIAGAPIGVLGSDGIYRSSISVPFNGKDNMSGFPTAGDLNTDMATKTVSGPGRGLYITSDGLYDRAGNYAEPITIGPFDILFPNVPQTYENMIDELRVYYEILEPSQFLSVEPAQKIGLYAYHPLTETDMSAFDELVLDVEAYEFIEEQIKRKEDSYFENTE